MKWSIRLLVCAAILGLPSVASAQGPIRRGLRAAGEATVGAARATAQGIRAGVDAVTPDVPLEARASGVVDRNAAWRRIQHNGDWWYYSPENTWMVYRSNTWIPYSPDTFTPNPQYAGSANDAQQMVFIDSGGRAIACQGGRIVFLDGTALRSVPRAQINAHGYFIEQNQLQAQGGVGVGSPQVNAGVAGQTQTGVAQSTFVQPVTPAPGASAQAGAQQGLQGQGSATVPPSTGVTTTLEQGAALPPSSDSPSSSSTDSGQNSGDQ